MAASLRQQISRDLDLARHAKATGDTERWIAHAQRAVEVARASGGVMLARALLAFGDGSLHGGSKSAAEGAYREAVTLAEAANADYIRARALAFLMKALAMEPGREKEALAMRPLVEAPIQRTGTQSELQPCVLDASAMAKSELSDHTGAFADMKAALAAVRATMPPDDPRVAFYLLQLAVTTHNIGQLEESLKLEEEAIRIDAEAYGEHHPVTAVSAVKRAITLAQLGRCEEALPELTRARAILARALPPEDVKQLELDKAMGACYLRTGRYDDAEREFRAMQTALATAGRDNSLDMAQAWELIGVVEDLRHHFDSAAAIHRRALAAYETVLGVSDARLIKLLWGIGLAENDSGHPERAIPPLERALALCAAPGVQPPTVGNVRWALSKAIWRGKHDRARAIELAEAALRDLVAAASPEDEGARRELKEWLQRLNKRRPNCHATRISDTRRSICVPEIFLLQRAMADNFVASADVAAPTTRSARYRGSPIRSLRPAPLVLTYAID